MTSQAVRDPLSDHLLTPQNCALVIIDYQPSQVQTVTSIDHDLLVRNIVSVARLGKAYGLPIVLSTVNVAANGQPPTIPELKEVLSGLVEIDRTQINSWEDVEFRQAVEATGRKNIIMTGLWTEVCITWPTIEMLGAGYNIYVVEDCCGATSPAAQEAALSRMVQAGAVRLTTIGALLEWQRDWKNKEHYNALMGLLKQQAGAYGIGVEYAYTMVHHAPQSAQKPQIVPKKAS